MLLEEFKERQIQPKSPTLAPTELSEELFALLDQLSKRREENE
ncbi:MAG: hypothetical protein ACXAC7_04760 [Candidatus Hodarchaeales archaeon]|jgi:hypothetical protein